MKKLLKFITRSPLYFWFYKNNVVRFRWDRLFKDFTYDFFKYKKTTFKEKLWAYKRGFLSERIRRYNLTNENYKEYVSDIEFYTKKMYINGRYSNLYDNKLLTYYLLQPFKEFMPKHYWFIQQGTLFNLNFNNKMSNIQDVLKLLKEVGSLILKPMFGGDAKGIIIFQYSNENFYMFKEQNKTIVAIKEIEQIISKLSDYLITEYSIPINEFRNLHNNSSYVVRVVTTFVPNLESDVIMAALRISVDAQIVATQNKIYVDCGIDLKTGELFNPQLAFNEGKEYRSITEIPNTDVKIQGIIPNWDFIKIKCIEISNYLKITPFLSYDIILTDDTFKIIEINSHGMPFRFQTFNPFYKKEIARKVFKKE